MAADRHVQIGHDAQDNVIITGDHGQVYVFPGLTELSPTLLAQLHSGTLILQEEPTAVPLPSLTLRIACDDAQRTTWTVTPVYPNAQGTSYSVPIPWHTQRSFTAALEGFWDLSRRALADAGEVHTIHSHALTLGEALGTVLTPADRQLLETRARDDGHPPLLIIESTDEATLALPWELLRLQGRYTLHDGRLDIARCVPATGTPHLARPTAPVTLLMTIAAPDHSGLDYEAESYYITRALHDHVGVVVNEMGELDDLVMGLRGEPSPLGVHFSGHGGPGQLLFEDEFGGSRTVDVEEMLNAIRRVAPERFPRFFYLACCHGGDAPSLSGHGATAQSGLPATVTALHREGVVQVVAYFGPVYDRQSTLAETAFYAEIARGRRTRDAVRAARLAMARPFVPFEREKARDVPMQLPDGATPFAWAQLVFYHRGPDYPLGISVPPKYAMTVEAPPAREEEPVFVSGRSYVLHKGFIGRRKEFHALRRDLHQGHSVHVVQGLGGLGKTAFCYEALKLYKRQGRDVLTLWCAEVEQEVGLVSALMRQLSENATALLGEAWEAAVAAVDSLATRQPALQRPAIRLIALMRTLLRRQGQPPLVLYLDNLESLLHGPNNDDGEAFGTWRDTEAQELWCELVRTAQASGGRLALLASCRYRHPDFVSRLVPLGRLPDDAVWRMLGWFPSLRRLSAASRARLVTQLAGHPRAVTWLDGLLSHAIAQWEERHGTLPAVPTGEQVQQEWETIVAPVLPSLTQRLSEDLLFEALWAQVLDTPARCLLVRATVLRRSADWLVLRALAAEEGEEAADAAIRCVRDASLLTEVQEHHTPDGTQPRFEVHPTVVHLVRQHAPNADELLRQGHRRAGDILAERARHSTSWSDDFEAAYHLGEVGETDRAFGLLLSLVEWLASRGGILDRLVVLDSLQHPELLNLQNQGRFLILRGQVYADLGSLSRALTDFRQAVEIGERLAQQDPSNAEWQRDLSVSHNRIGDMLAAQGEAVQALTAYRASLAIVERLAQQDPSNAQWQRDLSVSHNRIGDMLVAQGEAVQALTAYRASLAIAERLAQQDPSNAQWQRDLSVSHNRIGDMLAAQGEAVQALTAYRASLAIRERLAQQDPSNAEWQRDLSVSHDRIGDMLAAQGEAVQALTAYRASLAIRERLAQQDPSNAQWQRDLSVSHDRIGNMLAAQGEAVQALTAYRASLAIRERLAQQDPSNAQWQRDLSISHDRIGNMLAAQGEAVQALTAYRASLAIRERLAQQDPSNAQWQRDLSISHNKIGDMLAAQGEAVQALTAYRASLAIRERLAQQDPSNAQWQRDLSVSHDRIGDMLAAQGEAVQALTAYRASLAIAERLAQQDPSNAQWQRDLSVSHDRIGDMLAAQGEAVQALTAYRASLAIAERLAQQDPSNAEWQTDVAVSYWKLVHGKAVTAEDDVDTKVLLEQGLAILYRLRDASRLTRAQEDWIALFEGALQDPPPPRGVRRLLAHGRAWLHRLTSR